jgi:hypothetical protein
MKTTVFIVLIIAFGYSSHAQTMYNTVEGQIVVIGEYKGDRIVAQSRELTFYLNYTTKVFIGRIDLKTFRTGVSLLDSLILTNNDTVWLSFSGTIPDDDFIAWKHPVLKFNVPVTVKVNGIQRQLVLAATIEHIENSGSFVCSLTGFMNLSISLFNFDVPGFKDTIKAQFFQLLLKKQL